MLRLEALSKRFGSTVAVEELDLEVSRGEFLTLLGPSGCGKTTTLRMIAGFETPTSGKVVVDGRDVSRLPPQKRGFGMVFQNYALFPHLNVFENVAYGLKAQGVEKSELAGRVKRALQRVDLDGYESRSVQALSGGQQQRVALARALAPEPPLLLLDEPLSNLDAALRERTREELRSLLKQVGITSIFVTHDQEEAFGLSDRIAVMRGGHLQQVGTPEELYRTPANPFVAAFVGRANFLDGNTAAPEGGRVAVDLAQGARWQLPAAGKVEDPRAVRVMVRPEAIILDRSEPSAGSALHGEVIERRFSGAFTTYLVRLDDGLVLSVAAAGDSAALGDEVWVTPKSDPPPQLFDPENHPES